jgi:hypothetical protein
MMRYSRIALFMCVLLALITDFAIAQDAISITIRAIVKDTNGLPISGVNIDDKLNKARTASDKLGAFVIKTKPEAILTISALGYATKSIVAI